MGILVSNPGVMGHQAAVENCYSNFLVMLALLSTGSRYQSCSRFKYGKGDCKWSGEANLHLIDISSKIISHSENTAGTGQDLVTAPWDDTMWYDRALPLFWRTVLPHFLS
jgi:hypothetical protein